MVSNYLMHHGVKGQKWGVRRYQNLDGSLTARGKKRVNIRNKALEKASSVAKQENSRVRDFEETYNKFRSGQAVRGKTIEGYEKQFYDLNGKELGDKIIRESGHNTYKDMAFADLKENIKRGKEHAKQFDDIYKKMKDTPVDKMFTDEDYYKELKSYATGMFSQYQPWKYDRLNKG